MKADKESWKSLMCLLYANAILILFLLMTLILILPKTSNSIRFSNNP